LNVQGAGHKLETFFNIMQFHNVGLAYFFGSQKDLGQQILDGQEVNPAPASDLDLGIVLADPPLEYRTLERIRKTLQEQLQPLFASVLLHVLILPEENAHVQYAAIHGILAYAMNNAFLREYRLKVFTLYADWHSWWP
jgi:hypothetical protein